jgi:alpha-galactosidase
LFNTHDRSTNGNETSLRVPVKFSELGLTHASNIRNLWMRQNLGSFTNEFAPDINFHGAGLYRFSP